MHLLLRTPMGFKLKHWGVVIGPGETVKCHPCEFCCHISQISLHAGKGNEDVRIFVKVDDKEILIATLSDDKYPHHTTDLDFEKEFEILHTSKTRNISIIGYKYSKLERKSDYGTEEDDESDDEFPLAIPLYPTADDDKSKETESGSEKLVAPRPAATQSSSLEEPKAPVKLQTDVGCSDNVSDEDYADSEEGESIGDEDTSNEDDSKSSDEDDDANLSMNAKDKNRPAEIPLKTPPKKKAKITTPSKGSSTGSGTGTRSIPVRLDTRYPPKQLVKIIHSSRLRKNTPSTGDNPNQPAGYACESCSRTFYSYIALKTHCKVKKHKRSAH